MLTFIRSTFVLGTFVLVTCIGYQVQMNTKNIPNFSIHALYISLVLKATFLYLYMKYNFSHFEFEPVQTQKKDKAISLHVWWLKGMVRKMATKIFRLHLKTSWAFCFFKLTGNIALELIAKLSKVPAPAVLSFSLIRSFSDPPSPRPGKSCQA